MYFANGQSVLTEDMSLGVRQAEMGNAKDQPHFGDGDHASGEAQIFLVSDVAGNAIHDSHL